MFICLTDTQSDPSFPEERPPSFGHRERKKESHLFQQRLYSPLVMAPGPDCGRRIYGRPRYNFAAEGKRT